MKILVTGGTGVIGQSTIARLLERNHTVRLLSRHATDDAKEWPRGVEPVNADMGDPESLRGAADGCEVVLHIAGIVAEKPPEITFQQVNVEGTRHIVAEANRAGVKRFIFISSLGADRGSSDYHRSKFDAEQEVRAFRGDAWLIVRPGNVYGPGDEVLSLLLKLVRSLPAIPLIDQGDQQFQPVWHEDLAEALLQTVERTDLASQVLEIGGSELTSMSDVLDRLAEITGRSPARVPIPNFLAEFTASAAGALGVNMPIDSNKLTMLQEENVVRGTNALTDVFRITPTPLDVGLRKLAEALPEKLPSDGYGPLREKHFYADIVGSKHPREQLFEMFKATFSEVMPIDVGVEEHESRPLVEGQTISMKLPLRGTIQVRVEKVTSSNVTLATLEGHPIAGMVRFSMTNRDQKIRFEVRVIDRSGSFFDFFAMETVGKYMQDANWANVVQRVIDMSGGTAPEGIIRESRRLMSDEADQAEHDAEELVRDRKRKEHARDLDDRERAENR